MDINVQAFEIKLANGVSTSDLLDQIHADSGKVSRERYTYVSREKGWWHGLLLTARNIKAFSRMRRNGGNIVIEPENLGESELAHFNYFLLNERTRKGLYQYYHGSATVHGLGWQLKHSHNAKRAELLARACRDEGANPEKPPSGIRRRFSGYFSYTQVLRKKSFEQLVRDLREVKKLSVQFKKYVPGNRIFRPLAEKSRSLRLVMSFRDQYKGSVKDDLIALVKNGGIKDLRGVGVGEDNLEKRFRLMNEPENLGRFDFNDVVLQTAFDSGNVARSLKEAPMIGHLREIAEQDAWFEN